MPDTPARHAVADAPPGRPPRASGLHAWVLCVVAAVVGMGLRALLTPLLPDGDVPFVFAFVAVAVVALRASVPYAFVTVMLCAAWGLAPIPPSPGDTNGPLQVGLFVSAASMLALLVGAPRPGTGDAGLTGARLRDLLDGGAGTRTPLVRWLTAAFLAAAIVPLVLFVAIAAYAWRQAFDEARERLDQEVRLAHDYSASALVTSRDIFGRLQERIAGRDTAALRADEARLHQHAVDLATGTRYVQSVWIIAADGSLIASNQFFPSPPDIDSSGREYFAAHRAGFDAAFVSQRLESRFDGRPLFTVSVPRAPPGARFDGVFAVGVNLLYFDAFFESLVQDLPEMAIGLARRDGRVLTGYPAVGKAASLPEDSPVLAALSGGDGQGRLARAVWPDGVERFGAFRQVEGLPLFVFATLPTQAVLAGWYRSVTTIALFMFPIALSLMYVSTVALRRTRREQQAVLELRETEAQRAQAERALQDAQKLEALGRLTGGVAHDFNNLLMTVNNAAHVLRRLSPSGVAQGQVDALLRAVSSGRQLTRQLLTVARRQPLSPEAIDLARRLGPISDLVRLSIGTRVQVEHRVEPGTPNVLADASGLQLAILNLAINARDAMPDGGRLRIVASLAARAEPPAGGPRWVAVAVGDTGHGMTPEVRAKALEPFFSTKGELGTGLGLSQVYGFCTQSGGTMQIDSAPGQGTTVTLFLPSTAEPDTAVPEGAPDAATGSGSVLYVEDNPDVALTTQALLTALGYRCDHASNAEEALQRVRSAPDGFTAVLSDIDLAGPIDGIELADRLREEIPSLRVVLMTGYTDRLAEAVARGFTVIAKPCEPRELSVAFRRGGQTAV